MKRFKQGFYFHFTVIAVVAAAALAEHDCSFSFGWLIEKVESFFLLRSFPWLTDDQFTSIGTLIYLGRSTSDQLR